MWVTGRGRWWCDRYKVVLTEGGNYTPRLPLLNGRMYDNEVEQQYYAIFDTNKVEWHSHTDPVTTPTWQC